MKHYTERTFDFHELEGISEKTMQTHLGLYAGYVKNTNLVIDLAESMKDDTDKKYALLEARRRFSFEFDGMRNHEYFFEQLTGGINELDPDSRFAQKIVEDFGSIDAWKESLVALTGMRGIGFAICYYDREADRLLNSWVEEQHLGQLNSAQFIFGIDMWEHAFMLDYAMSDKPAYVDAVWKNTNWSLVADRFEKSLAK